MKKLNLFTQWLEKIYHRFEALYLLEYTSNLVNKSVNLEDNSSDWNDDDNWTTYYHYIKYKILESISLLSGNKSLEHINIFNKLYEEDWRPCNLFLFFIYLSLVIKNDYILLIIGENGEMWITTAVTLQTNLDLNKVDFNFIRINISKLISELEWSIDFYENTRLIQLSEKENTIIKRIRDDQWLKKNKIELNFKNQEVTDLLIHWKVSKEKRTKPSDLGEFWEIKTIIHGWKIVGMEVIIKERL